MLFERLIGSLLIFLMVAYQLQAQSLEEVVSTAIMCEAPEGTREEQIAIGFASQRNRMQRTCPVPSDAVQSLAKDIVNGLVQDNTQGASHWYSPRSMPKEGDSTVGVDVAGGLESTTGLTLRNYKPGWISKCVFVAISGVRLEYFKFYKC